MSDTPTDRPVRERDATEWWKDAVIYQIYPRSFMDGNGDGIGDLRGIIGRLDHCQALGVDAIWLGPVFASPDVDNGYDISDYRRIMPAFGTMADFDEMLAEMTRRGIRLIMDLVVNHTSDEHEWFQESRKSRDNPYRDHYIWRDGKDGGPPNNYSSFFGGGAWEHDPRTDQYYLHYFDRKQPDLNWENPRVRRDVHDIVRFWIDKGVSGFRMDVIPFISKRDGLPPLSDAELEQPEFVYADGPRVHDYLQEMVREVPLPRDVATVGEAFGVTFEQTPLFTDAGRGELGMIFHFDLVRLGRDGWRTRPWTVPELKAVHARVDRAAGRDGWATSFLENHDTPRAVSHFGDGSPASAKALAVMTLTQRATPFLYQGQEIGMTNHPFGDIGTFQDLAVHGRWRELVLTGKVTAEDFLRDMRLTSRDNSRTPMQWDGTANAGFTAGTPWLAVNPNHAAINVATQADDPDSVLGFHRRLIALRKAVPALVHGTFRDVDPDHPAIFAYVREDETDRCLVAINLTGEPVDFAPGDGLAIGRVLIDTHAGQDHRRFPPWRAAVFELALPSA